MELLTACLMVTLTLIVMATRRPGKDTSMLWASGLISISLVLNINSAYVFTDHLLGQRNYTDLGANLLLLVGVYFLARAIHRAASPLTADRSSPRVLGKSGVVVATTLTFFFFICIEAPVTSTSFMRDFGSQPAAALYSAIQYAYIGSVMATAGWTCLRFRKSWSTGVYAFAFALVGLGCTSAVLLVLQVLVLDALHVMGQLEVMSQLGGVYAMLNFTTFALLCMGLAIPPVGRRVLSILVSARTSKVLKDLRPVWAKAVVGNSQVTLDLHVVPKQDLRQGRELHRMVVEIQDSLARDPDAKKRIGTQGMTSLSEATEFLEGLAWRQN